MADTGNVLSATLQVKDSFSSQLNKFSQSLNNAENAFNKFCLKIDQSSSKIEQTLDRVNKKMEQTTNKIISQSDKVSNSIIKSSQKTEQQQNKMIDDLSKKYTKMGGDIENVFKKAQQDIEKINPKVPNIPNSPNSPKDNNSTNSSKTENMIANVLGGHFNRVLTSLGIIGGVLTGASKVLSTLDGWAQQGFNALNTLSTGLLSVDGIKEGLQEAGQFEQNRVSMDMLYGGDKNLGHEYYKMGVQSAKKTTYGEEETGELQKKLAGAHISYNQDQLNLLADIASLRPEQPLSKVGFSIVDAMYGRTTSLKSQYMLDNKEVQAYLKKLQKTDPTDAKKWQNAFNKKGAVDNKQEYFDLLMNFVEKETNYKGLNGELMKTMLGKVERLQGNWETLKADLLGIDANDTGTVKSGKITVISSIESALDNFDEWLGSDNTKKLLDDVGTSLGTAVKSVSDAFLYLLNNIDWKEVGNDIKELGKDIADFIKKLKDDGTLSKLLKLAPTLIEKSIGNEIIDKKNNVTVASDMAQGNWLSAFDNWIYGKETKAYNLLGVLPTSKAIEDKPQRDTSMPIIDGFNNWLSGIFGQGTLTDSNASSALAKNTNLDEAQKNTIQGMIQGDNQTTYNVTIGTIQADSFDDIVASIKKAQNNQ